MLSLFQLLSRTSSQVEIVSSSSYLENFPTVRRGLIAFFELLLKSSSEHGVSLECSKSVAQFEELNILFYVHVDLEIVSGVHSVDKGSNYRGTVIEFD